MTRIGSLCSGYGGLDQAAEQVTGGNVAWFCEYDDAPSKLLAHYFPAVPNYGDLKALEWADDPVDVLTAGYPCQPFSGAGKRLGTDDPRHLFPWIARGVERMRPPLLLLENVRGHLSLGFDVVLAELDRIGYDVRWTLLRAADVGAPHGRARLWIAARAREVGGWPRPAGEPTAYGEADGWISPEAGLFGHVPAATPGTAGVMVDGQRWDRAAGPCLLESGTASSLLPTPRTTDTNGAGEHGTGGLDLRTAVSLLLLLNGIAAAEQWGPYTAAVRRWETLTRPAPAPTEQGRSGPRLSPAFVEWMQGLTAGWVTDVPGVTRNHALKMLGNGCVPQCAAAAFALLGVSDLYREVAA